MGRAGGGSHEYQSGQLALTVAQAHVTHLQEHDVSLLYRDVSALQVIAIHTI